tara:strand:+ start:587 stop:1531 length:945 start_codon:yes stop_codon:yes gene_type:complete
LSKPDYGSLTPEEYRRICLEAERLLAKADALGQFPTPIDSIMTAAEVEEIKDEHLDDGFLSRMRREAGSNVRKAFQKIQGLFHAAGRLVFIDKTVLKVKQTFLRLHEAGHAVLPWHRKIYALVETSEQELDPDTADLFDREANVFASEVVFQLDTFINEAEQMPFGIKTPLGLSKKYGASVYASIRQYVSKNHRACAVVVLNKPEMVEGDGFRAGLRRVVASEKFKEQFGDLDWPDHFTPGDQIGAMAPVGQRRMSGKREISLIDRNGDRHECFAEAFNNTYNIFVLIHAVQTLTKSAIIMPNAEAISAFSTSS